MQLPAEQTSLEPQPHRVDPVRPQAVREPERPKDNGSRFASEPDQIQRLRIQPQTPNVESNKLPNIAQGLSASPTMPLRRYAHSLGRPTGGAHCPQADH